MTQFSSALCEIRKVAPAQTAAPFSRTTGGEPTKSRSKPGRFVALALGLGAIGALLILTRKDPEPPAETSNSAPTSTQQTAAAPPTQALPSALPSAAEAPIADPSAAPNPVPSAAPRAAGSASASPKRADPRQRSGGGNRAREHGLSEENPF